MTDETKPTEAVEAEDNRTPMERAVAGGYQEPEQPSRDDRVMSLVHAMQHAIKHNAPVTQPMIDEMRDLLGVKADAPEQDHADADGA